MFEGLSKLSGGQMFFIIIVLIVMFEGITMIVKALNK